MIYRFGEHVLDTSRQELRRDGNVVPLEPKAYHMLVCLVSSGGRLIGKEELLRQVWPGVNVDETAVRRCIRNIRQALGESRLEQGSIETRHGRGYRFLPQVVIGEPQPGPEPPAGAEPESAPQPTPKREKEVEEGPSVSLLDTAILLSQSSHVRWSKRSPSSTSPLSLRPEVFFNANFGIALAIPNHPDHGRARAIAEDFLSRNTHFVTTRMVLLEVAVKVSEALGSEAGLELLDASEDDKDLEIIWLSEELYAKAKGFAQRHHLRGSAGLDFVSHYLMHERDIPEAMSQSEQRQRRGKLGTISVGILVGLGCTLLTGVENWLFSLLPGTGNRLGHSYERAFLILVSSLIACLIGALFAYLIQRTSGEYDRSGSSFIGTAAVLLTSFFMAELLLTFWMLALKSI